MAAKSKPYEQFGPYILFKKLESDTLGDLFRAGRIENGALGSIVALRRMTGGNRDAMNSAVPLARQVAPLLTGPSFVRNQTIDSINGIPFIAHDYAGGRSLRHVVDRARGGNGIPPNPIPLDQALVIVERVALSLATIGELRFAGERLSHGALLPQFIWISDDGEIRVAGQQLGKGLVGSVKDPKSSSEIARYLSPEYQHSGEVTKSSEVYSIGAILYLVLTGLEPPDAMSTSAFAAAIRAAKTMAGTPIPEDIHAILVKALNLDPASRYGSVADMKQAISALTSGGKYSATSFNLAFYLSNLLKKELEGEAVERDKESKISVAPYVELLSGPQPAAAAQMPMAAATAEPPSKSKAPIAIAAAVALAVIGGGAWFMLGSKKAAPAPAQQKLASVVAPAAPKKPQPFIPEPILASASPQTTTAVTATTGSVDPAAQKKAFEDAVKQKLHEEMMKLQADYTKQLQQQQSKNAPVPVAPSAPAATQAETQQPSRTTDERPPEPSAAQLDLQRQRETVRPQDAAQQVPAQTTQAPAPAVQDPAASAPAVAQVHEGDVVDINDVDVAPKRTRDPYVQYPPMAIRQRIETNVLATVLVSETGTVLEVNVLRGDNRFGFTDAAVRALKVARYSPAMKNGKHVKTWLPQIIQFKP
jgi:eukaryotic-like serine/threonine-protein kinase